ncbi:MAG: hypothetical protein ACUVYA_14350 [Planctomycetota bacterium]
MRRPPSTSAAKLACLVLALASRTAPAGDALGPLSIRGPEGPIERLARAEFSIAGVPEAENPFDPDEIAVDATLRGPSGKELRIPAFYARDYERSLEGGREVLRPAGEPGCRLRPAALAPGPHELGVAARIAGKLAASASRRLDVRPGGGAGFVRVEPRRRRYFQLDDGSPLFLVGLCASWHDARGTYDYDDWLAAYERAGINYIRIWMWHHAFGIEWDREDRTRYRLDRAWTLDRVLGEAERRGIRVMLCLDYHGILETKPDFWGGNDFWPRHPYNAANGGPCATQNDFFTSPEARKLYRKRLRYIVARWSAFPGILAWQFFNEIDNVYGYLKPEDVAAWHRDMARDLRELDPYGHLITTSLTGKSERREIWEIPELDFAQYHSYNEERPARVTARVASGFFERYQKPVFVGEYGTDFRGWKPETDPHLRALHQAIWSGAFAGAAGTAMSWWWQSIHEAGRYGSWASLSAFLRGTGAGSGEFEPLPAKPEGEVAVEAFAVGSKREALLWLLDPRYSWPQGALEDPPSPCSGARVAIEGPEDAAYAVEWWDPAGGRSLGRVEVEARGGKLVLSPDPFRADLAARIRRAP